MNNTVFLLAATMIAGAFAAPASAATNLLDFTQGNYCRGGQLCTNNGTVDQSYGDTAEVDMTYSSIRGSGQITQAFYYERGFGDLVGVLFAGNGDPAARGQILLSAAAGFELALTSFDIGCFGGSASCQTASYSIFGDTTQLIDATTATDYPGHTTLTPNTGYFKQIALTFGSGENIGLDNLRFQTRAINSLPNVPAVPEPATWAMMLTGFGLMGGVMRRRSVRTRFLIV